MWPLEFHFLVLICFSVGLWLVLTHSSLLLIVSGHHSLNVLLRDLPKQLWIFCSINFLTRHVSELYISTALPLELKCVTVLIGKFLWICIHLVEYHESFPYPSSDVTVFSYVCTHYTSYICEGFHFLWSCNIIALLF